MGKVCQGVSAIGEGCLGEAACGSRASCVVEHDGEPRCHRRAKLNEPCRADESLEDDGERPRCDVDAGLGCVAGKCARTEWLPPGAICSAFDDARRCLGGACDDGACKPLPREGAGCLGGWTCLPPANCLSGTCALPSAAACASSK